MSNLSNLLVINTKCHIMHHISGKVRKYFHNPFIGLDVTETHERCTASLDT